jgi:putative FmdB family regulatory protein
MPIYAYRCTACGHAQDVLQKMSDPLLTLCPACGDSTYAKQLTAAGFQLKGSGWYVTDFRGGNGAAKPAAEGADGKPDAPAGAKGEGANGAAADGKAAPAAAPASPNAPASTASPTTASTPAAAPAASPTAAKSSAPKPASGGAGGSGTSAA